MAKEKVFVIVIDEVFEFQRLGHYPYVFKSEKSAMKKLRELREEVIEDLKKNGNYDSWAEDEFDMETSKCFSWYQSYEWGTSHYDATIYESEVENE